MNSRRTTISTVLIITIYLIDTSIAFVNKYVNINDRYHFVIAATSKEEKTTKRPIYNNVCEGNLLSDIPTPCILLELSLLERGIRNKMNKTTTSTNYDDCNILNYILNNNDETIRNEVLDASVFIHTKVVNTTARDKITKEYGSGKSKVICSVDANTIPGGDAYLGIGLANHHVGGYYWARGMGIGASLEAHGVSYRSSSTGGELYWKKQRGIDKEGDTTEESSNSNDGKRSEWVDFLMLGDTVQLIPYNPSLALSEATTLLGIRRIGRPLGADPIVETIWHRSSSSSIWKKKIN